MSTETEQTVEQQFKEQREFIRNSIMELNQFAVNNAMKHAKNAKNGVFITKEEREEQKILRAQITELEKSYRTLNMEFGFSGKNKGKNADLKKMESLLSKIESTLPNIRGSIQQNED